MSHPERLGRRAVLASAATLAGAGLAGCTSPLGTSKGATEVVLHNERAEPIAVSLAIAGTNADEPRFDGTVRLDPHERARPTESDQLPVGTDYTVDVTVEGGPSETFEWRDVRLELAPLHVIVDDSEDVLFALEAG